MLDTDVSHCRNWYEVVTFMMGFEKKIRTSREWPIRIHKPKYQSTPRRTKICGATPGPVTVAVASTVSGFASVAETTASAKVTV